MTGHRQYPVIALAFLLGSTNVEARTWIVRPDGLGDAATIQAAVDSAAAGDDVLIAAGVYTWSSPPVPWSATIMVHLKPGIWLHSEDGAQATVLDGQHVGGLLLCEDIGTQVRIEGLCLQNGAGIAGAGLWSRGNSEPTIANCIFRNNSASWGLHIGGGIACDIATIENCEFMENHAGSEYGGAGGAIYCGAAHIRHCTFRGNRSYAEFP